MGDALHHDMAFPRWCSEFEQDKFFGSSGDFFQVDLRGENVFVNPPFNDSNGEPRILMRVVERCIELGRSERPTRIVLVIPRFNGDNGDRFLGKGDVF